jgi:hypothetical protein
LVPAAVEAGRVILVVVASPIVTAWADITTFTYTPKRMAGTADTVVAASADKSMTVIEQADWFESTFTVPILFSLIDKFLLF